MRVTDTIQVYVLKLDVVKLTAGKIVAINTCKKSVSMTHERFKCHIEEHACYFCRSELINHLKSKHGICIGR